MSYGLKSGNQSSTLTTKTMILKEVAKGEGFKPIARTIKPEDFYVHSLLLFPKLHRNIIHALDNLIHV